MSASLTGTGLRLTLGHNQVLRGVDIHVDAGKTTTVIGPSGSGKSTLLRVLNRLHEPDQGDVLLDGKSVLTEDPDKLRQRIGMVFQHFNLFPHKTVAENVALGPRKLRGLSKDAARALAVEQLEVVGLADKADSRPANLSGGQQQRVAIARALAMQPEIMFFDEATSALDPELVKGILALMAELATQGMSMIVVTHEMGFARSVSDSVLFMDAGQVVETGTPDALFDNPRTPRLQRFLSQVL
ncbi:amino acid ABC transporter ATP-binding protein [Nocardia sp. NPDC049707]|uniref:amino acid ABC transporter ATP-binding protein n=1 Tax=Nocardia sp. NPDC049707 TaxID=3154735 RepID=UPI00342B6955